MKKNTKTQMQNPSQKASKKNTHVMQQKMHPQGHNRSKTIKACIFLYPRFIEKTTNKPKAMHGITREVKLERMKGHSMKLYPLPWEFKSLIGMENPIQTWWGLQGRKMLHSESESEFQGKPPKLIRRK